MASGRYIGLGRKDSNTTQAEENARSMGVSPLEVAKEHGIDPKSSPILKKCMKCPRRDDCGRLEK